MAVKSRILLAVAVVGLLFAQDAVARTDVEVEPEQARVKESLEGKADNSNNITLERPEVKKNNPLEILQETMGKEKGKEIYEQMIKDVVEKEKQANKKGTLEEYQQKMGKDFGKEVYEQLMKDEGQAKEKPV